MAIPTDFVAHYTMDNISGVIYYPELTVYAKASQTDINLATAEFGWQIEAEEV